ncbi:MAG TPA: serine/threonine-protein kinase, partial [Actinomycetota bacterium]|nr:serine/threonine-protein kinase [Actinomycetota bacterium]
MTSGPAPGANLGSYRIDSLLGRGGMGVVYLAEHIHLGRKVALKVLAPDMADDEEFRQRFLRESQMAARVEHKNIIPVYDAGEADGLLYISMRYVDGSDLKTLITERAPLETDYALGLMGQVASALDAAHKHGLVHRDVKPGNILIEPDGSRYGRVYLTDFGLTKMANSHTSVTKTGMFLGSIDYAAPEQWEGKQLDGRTDIYALGCVAFECLTGEVPYLRETPLAAMHAHLMEPPPRVGQRRPDLGDDIDRGIQRAMSKSPDDRHFDCLSFIDEMRGRGLHRGQAGGTAAHVSPPG